MNRSRPIRYGWVRHLGIAPLVFALCLPMGVDGQVSARPDSGSTPVRDHADRFRPDIRKGREMALWGVGTALVVAGLTIPTRDVDVPLGGFDLADIAWSFDRNIVGNRSVDAHIASSWTRNVALVFPFAMAFATSQGDERWNDYGRRSFIYAETILMSQGITLLAKAALGRARPFAYLPEGERPRHVAYDVSLERTFRSMPSGHAASAWTGAALAMTDHLLSRSEASLVERVGVGFLGGALAGATSALRVEAGQHFPSDVFVGAGIGIMTGITVPLLHRGTRSLPSSEAWLQMMGGTLAGTLLGVVVALGS